MKILNSLVNIITQDGKKVCHLVDLSPIRGKIILLTGASGLIGVNLLASLKNFADLHPGSFKLIAVMQSQPPDFVKALLNYPQAKVMSGDLTNTNFLIKLPQADLIIHAAGYGQPRRFLENPVKTIYLNTATTLALFNKLKKDGKFLFMSTSEVYSGLANPPFSESEIGTTNTDHPRACYIEGKRTGEAICQAFRQQGIDSKAVRLSLAYGPGTKPGDQRVLNNFIEKALHGQVELLDGGEAKRTYCYVTDAVEMIWQVLLYGHDGIYNVGGKSRVTIAQLAKKIGKILNVPVVFPQTESQLKGAPDDVYLDMEKIKKEFGKKKFVSFDDGLLRTVKWQKALYNSLSPKTEK